MGGKRVKESKKASKQQPDDATTRLVSRKLENLNLDNDSATTLVPSSEAPSSPIQNQDSPNTEDSYDDDLVADPSYIEIQTTEHKGVSVFAARKIPTGTLILSEPPLIRLTQAEEDAEEDVSSLLEAQFNLLPKPTQKLYLALFDSQKSGFSRLKSIYYSNCYNLSNQKNNRTDDEKGSLSSPGGSCIGVIASRLNHSCVPNVQFSFDEENGLMLFYAIKPIPKGREVLSCYDSVFEGREARGRRLMLYYGFRCDCEACMGEGFWGRSDERRKGMREGWREVKAWERVWKKEGRLSVGMDPVGVLSKVEGLLVKEQLVGLPLADVYRRLERWCERLGDERAMRKWRGRELEVCVNCLGRRNGRVEELRGKLGLRT